MAEAPVEAPAAGPRQDESAPAPPSPPPAPSLVPAREEDAQLRAMQTVRALLRDGGAAATDDRCWIDMVTQYECSVQYSRDTAVSVCYPVQRFFKRCAGKANVEITSLIHTPQDRFEHRRRHANEAVTVNIAK